MRTTRKPNRTRTGKLAATTAAAALSLLSLTALAGPAGANEDTTAPATDPMAVSSAAADQAATDQAAADQAVSDVPSGSINVHGVRIIKKRSGDLSIIDVGGRDAIAIWSGAQPGHIDIVLSGGLPDVLVWSGPVRNLTLSTGNGSDRIYLGTMELPGNLSVNLGQDGGNLTMNGVTVNGRTSIRAGSNRTGSGASVEMTDSELRGPLTLIGGRTDDRFSLLDSTIAGRLSIRAGAGNNDTELVGLDGVTRFDYRGGQGRDTLYANERAFGTRSSINTDGGDDLIRTFGKIDGLAINSGRGHDHIELGGLDWSPGDVVRVIAGSGDDAVIINPGLGETSFFDGGAGNDEYFGSSSYRFRNFEVIDLI